MSWIDVGPADAIPARGARVVHLGGETIALFRSGDGRVFALRDRCPHRGGPLSQGIVHGCRVTCPLHDWVIDLATGEAVAPDEGSTAAFEVRVDGGRVSVRVPATAGQGRDDARGDATADPPRSRSDSEPRPDTGL